MRTTNDVQYFRVTGQMLEDCKRWAKEVYHPKIAELAAFVRKEFGATQVEYSLDFHGHTCVSAVQLPGDGDYKLPAGMRFVNSHGLIKPNKKTGLGKQYIKQFESLTLPPGASTVLDALFGEADTIYSGNGCYRRAQFFQAGVDSDWFFCCDVSQAIAMKFEENPGLIPITPIEMRKVEMKTEKSEPSE